jgi:hypothetical protein
MLIATNSCLPKVDTATWQNNIVVIAIGRRESDTNPKESVFSNNIYEYMISFSGSTFVCIVI